mgnify:CR=1 FL=1
MKIYIYKGGLSLVAKSGVGSAIRHQEKMLRAAKVTVTDVWNCLLYTSPSPRDCS